MKSVLVTGSSGLIGSEVCRLFDHHGYRVHGIDNNQREVLRDLVGVSPEIEVRLAKEQGPVAGKTGERPLEEEPIFRKAQDIFRGNSY